MDMYERVGFGMWVMVLRESGEPVGTCGLIRRESLDDVDIGFAMLPEHRGRGLTLEAARAVLEYAWKVVGLTRVVAIVSPANPRSIRILETIGMRFERPIRMPGEDEDISLYSWEQTSE
jgi:RimJ/RimL family protein N-acetyltransferase